ncbi:hypothetical protein [Nonomuraea guangzhouensis]|uniref:Uncharacterized protein n=1 Tax=Nonomuraea guangzhouensis TaxID=1291555 RepID=A0ABW4GXS8_9ACTN|nr:hypothetical protein [Nonomuraea guangzhouensis]
MTSATATQKEYTVADPYVSVPHHLPLAMQDIEIMRCATCGAIIPGTWNLSREAARAGTDHVLDEHREGLAAGRLQPPLFVNCAIQDPFWWEEHA